MPTTLTLEIKKKFSMMQERMGNKMKLSCQLLALWHQLNPRLGQWEMEKLVQKMHLEAGGIIQQKEVNHHRILKIKTTISRSFIKRH